MRLKSLDLTLFPRFLALIVFCNFDNTDIHKISPANQFIIKDVFHYARLFLLPEIKPGVAESYIRAILFNGILKILFAFYIISFRFVEQKRLNQIFQVFCDCACRYLDVLHRT